MKKWWIKFLWKQMPGDYRQDIKIRLLRTQISWKDKDRKTYNEINEMLKDIP